MQKVLKTGSRVFGGKKDLQGFAGEVTGITGIGHAKKFAVRWDNGDSGLYSKKALSLTCNSAQSEPIRTQPRKRYREEYESEYESSENSEENDSCDDLETTNEILERFFFHL